MRDSQWGTDVLVELTMQDSKYAGYLYEMHRRRHDLFVARRGWVTHDSVFGLDLDEFDHAKVSYLVLIETEGQVIVRGATRLTPAEAFTQLAVEFSHFVPDGIPTGDDVYEFGRFGAFAPPGLAADDAEMALAAGLVAFGLKHDVKLLFGLVESSEAERLEKLPWSVSPLGPVQKEFGRDMVAISIHMDDKTIDRFENMGLMPRLADMSVLPPRASRFRGDQVGLVQDLTALMPDQANDLVPLVQRLGQGGESLQDMQFFETALKQAQDIPTHHWSN